MDIEQKRKIATAWFRARFAKIEGVKALKIEAVHAPNRELTEKDYQDAIREGYPLDDKESFVSPGSAFTRTKGDGSIVVFVDDDGVVARVHINPQFS